jgi:hypothetical protein
VGNRGHEKLEKVIEKLATSEKTTLECERGPEGKIRVTSGSSPVDPQQTPAAAGGGMISFSTPRTVPDERLLFASKRTIGTAAGVAVARVEID